MRDYILLFINGREHKLRGEDAFAPISDYLRYQSGLCGTKVVCSEGDCGACSVLVGRLEGGKLRYRPVNACIQYAYQLDCRHIVTVEGLKVDGVLNPLQESMVDCHGAQCGYCTPGFVVAMSYLFEEGRKLAENEIKDGLTGNLCRCTGYRSIIEAGLAVDASAFKPVAEIYPDEPMVKAFNEAESEPAAVGHDGKQAYIPVSVEETLALRQEHPDALLVAGGTDVSVNLNKGRIELKKVITLANVKGLSGIERRSHGGRDYVVVGASVSLKELEEYMAGLEPELDYIMWVFGSPQIRNAGTLAGNIANGSPIADTTPYLMAMDAEVEVRGSEGSRRIGFGELYTGYKKLSLHPDEIITRIHVPLPGDGELLRLYKVSRRQHLDISAFTAAIKIELDGDLIRSASVAYGGIAEVVKRMDAVEGVLVGQTFSLSTFRRAAEIAGKQVDPISDVRGSREYRRQLAENIMLKFYYETADERELVCP
ncbi:MAG: FAD binding domain-containing protein [Candidatus Melainabacteria bacterium]|nr:FAD binding domain-containing protein [Candidatus Melainabacteria bacterium]